MVVPERIPPRSQKDQFEIISIIYKHLKLPNHSARVGYDTRSIFMQSLTGLNSALCSETGCCTKAREPSLPYYLPIAGGYYHYIKYK